MTAGESSRDDSDIEELESCMTRELNYYWSLGGIHQSGNQFCPIYKVPQHIRQVDLNAYEPIILSIGPYHHGTPALLAMEKEKWNCLDYILKSNCEKTLQDYVNKIRELENPARNCYSDDLKMDSSQFLKMLLLDGCFILVSLNGMHGIVPRTREMHGNTNFHTIIEDNLTGQMEANMGLTENGGECTEIEAIRSLHDIEKSPQVELSQVYPSEPNTQSDKTESEAHGQPDDNCNQFGKWFTCSLNHDLLLLENQIPFLVVKKIYHELVAGNDTEIPFTDIIAGFVENIVHCYPKAIQSSNRPKDFFHLLHLCHIYFRPSQKLKEEHQYQVRPKHLHRFLHLALRYFKLGHQLVENEETLSLNRRFDCFQPDQLRWRRAMHYHEAGVRFQKREFDKDYPHSLLDIRFNDAVLEIPCLHIEENTLSLFRNLIAFEQTCPEFGNDFTSYIFFMSQLISMPDDVTLLSQRGIIVQQLRCDKEVSTLFTKLSKDVVFDFNGQYYLKSMSSALEAHYQSRVNRWVAWLRNNHFSNPWLGLGVLAATIVLFCTLVQTLIAVLSYVKAP